MDEETSSRVPIDPEAGVIDLRLKNLDQLFNSLDPSPFHEKDLDPDAERLIVSWANDYPIEQGLVLTLRLNSPIPPDGVQTVRRALENFFTYKAEGARRELRALFRRGRTSLVIGLVFLAACVLLGIQVGEWFGPESTIGLVLREGLSVGGWVAMWGPMEIFLYGWWPLRHTIRLYDKLVEMRVEMKQTPVAGDL
jgi:hypothetical protein